MTVVVVEAAPKHPILPDSSRSRTGSTFTLNVACQWGSDVEWSGFWFTHDTTWGKMPLVCGVNRGMKALITRTVNTVIIAMKILISLISVSLVLARMGTRGGRLCP